MTDERIRGELAARARATSQTIVRASAVVATFLMTLILTTASAQTAPRPEQARLRQVVELLASPGVRRPKGSRAATRRRPS